MTSNVGVLIADDSATFLGAGIAVVESTPGFDLLGTAESGEQAIEVAARTRPDLIFIDVRMPGIGGLEAARRIHELQPSVVLILITAEELELEDGHAVAALLDKRGLSTTVLAELWRQHGQDRSA